MEPETPKDPETRKRAGKTNQTAQKTQARTGSAAAPAPPRAGHVDEYTEAEKNWLKKHHGNEFKFLQTMGLSIYKEEDREEGRTILRGFMKNDMEDTQAGPVRSADPVTEETPRAREPVIILGGAMGLFTPSHVYNR